MKLKIIIAVFTFSLVYALLFKWWTTGNPFHISTILFWCTNVVIIFTALILEQKFLQKNLNIPAKQLKKRIIPIYVSYLLILLFLSLCIISLGIYLFHIIMGLDISDLPRQLIEVEFPISIRYYLIMVLIVSSFFFYTIWHQTLDREQQLREENLAYKYKNLKTQVNPHFLFNSLNTLSEIIYTDTKRADNYIQKLAGIYRYILDHEETDLILLNEEIDFVMQYFDLQKERATGKIELNIDIENLNSYKIIPISLQVLIENALKHNAASESKPLRIDIFLENGYVVVVNDMQKKNILHKSGTGLSNLSERVKLIVGNEIIIQQENNRFLVKLPIIKIR